MGRLKEIIKKLPDDSMCEDKEFTVKVIEMKINKWFITTWKAKNKSECIKELNKHYNNNNYYYEIV